MNESYNERELPCRPADKVIVFPNGQNIEFWEKEHIYSVDGQYRICFSDSLVAAEIKEDISESGISEEYLQKCRDFGTEFHKTIEDFVKEGKEPLIKTPAFRFFKEKIYPLCTEWHSETIVTDGTVVGTCDLWGITKNGTVVVVDHKTGVIYRDSVEWQTTMYGKGLKYSKYIPEDTHIEHYCFSAKNTYEECALLHLCPKNEQEYNAYTSAIQNYEKYISPYRQAYLHDMLPESFHKNCLDEDEFIRNYFYYKAFKGVFEDLDDAIKNKFAEGTENTLIVRSPFGYRRYTRSVSKQNKFSEALFREKCKKNYRKYFVEKEITYCRLGKSFMTDEELEDYKVDKDA